MGVWVCGSVGVGAEVTDLKCRTGLYMVGALSSNGSMMRLNPAVVEGGGAMVAAPHGATATNYSYTK